MSAPKMREFEIYLPSKQRDGKKIKAGEIAKVKEFLSETFGGYTEINGCKGVWRREGVDSEDEITIVRVLHQGTMDFEMKTFRDFVERALRQERILITTREVKTV